MILGVHVESCETFSAIVIIAMAARALQPSVGDTAPWVHPDTLVRKRGRDARGLGGGSS
jgi:hypothetical protein